MASFVFENGTQTQASGFQGGDTLVFQSDLPTQLTITLGTAQFGTPTVTIADSTRSLQFSQDALSTASTAGRIQFFNSNAGSLTIGNDSANTVADAVVRGDSVFYTFGGNDAITIAAMTGGNANTGSATAYLGAGTDSFTANGSGIYTVFGEAGDDTINVSGSTANSSGIFGSYLNGGVGADTITGSGGNDHIYGNALGVAAGTSDGADSIIAGAGADYVNGNAGADNIDGGDGSDRLFGGADNDTILGGLGNDTVNGNTGADSIIGGAGSDFLRGGQGNDVIYAQAAAGGTALVDATVGIDILKGDAGSDTLFAGSNYDVLEGGADGDVFDFSIAGSARFFTSGTSAYSTDVVTDYSDGNDKFYLGFAVNTVVRAQGGVTFTTVQTALTYAQQRFDETNAAGTATSASVVAINVGSDAYLFYAGGGTGTTLNAAVKLLGIDQSVINSGTGSDFNAPPA